MTAPIENLHPRKRPRQARSRQMQADILLAAADILRRRGLPSLNTNAVAERAGVSVGSLYQYFPGKEAILAALVREMRRDMRADLLEAVARGKGRPLGEAIGELVDASLRHHARDPALTDALERAEDELPMDAETDALKADMMTLVRGVLERHGIEHPDRTAFDLIAMCHGMVHAALRAGETDLADLSHRMTRAALGYLDANAPNRG
jgi:AcrR family transcriptional regulator